ncbi:glycosyltransferase family 4 protein [Ascidiimonas aurantiaca]|uniref:glycosyltransferase family 4 protein n=1 Tax=Ascidiimonas aurantiaca TaxID=1685432 RepID=UPI0030EECD88
MKIDFIISSLRGGGAERVLTLLATHFAESQTYDVTVITINRGEEYELPSYIKRQKLSGGIIPNHTIRSFVNLTRYYARKKNRPDVIISFITLTNLIVIPVARLYNINIIATEHNSYLRVMPPLFLSNFTRKYLYRKANFVTVLTSFDLDFYQKYKAPVVVMPNPCTFKPQETYNTQRDKVILAVGKLDRYHHKGFDNLIPFIAPVLKANPEWTLKIAGSGDTGLKLLKELVEEHELEDQVVFLGFVSNISEIMNQSAVFILSSRFEGLPMVLLEAMSQGMASIAYNCQTGPSDIISDGKTGILVTDQDAEEMQQKLGELINDEKRIHELGTNALQALENFSIESVAKKYEVLFEKMVKK